MTAAIERAGPGTVGAAQARLTVVLAVTLVGAVACAFDPQRDQAGAGESPIVTAVQ